MSHDFFALVHGEREALFREIFGDNRVPIQSPIGEYVYLPGVGEPQFVYQLAIKELTKEQRLAIVRHLAGTFNYPADFVDLGLDLIGVPILARDASVVVHNAMRWLG